MMLRSKPALIVLVATTVSLTVVGPLPLWLRALLTIGVLLVLLVLFLLLLSPGLLLLLFLLLFLLALGLPLLILICGLRLLLLLFLLALGLLLFLFARPDCLLFLGLGLLLVLFGFGLLILLSIRGSKGSEKEGQSPHTDKPDSLHKLFLHHHVFVGHSLLCPRVVIAPCCCRPGADRLIMGVAQSGCWSTLTTFGKRLDVAYGK